MNVSTLILLRSLRSVRRPYLILSSERRSDVHTVTELGPAKLLPMKLGSQL